MTSFEHAYRTLNTAQKQAVDTIDGAVMVIAGPGTGKTQLLSTRAANIVAKGNANPNNILCLTYTETGASEMRERMTRIMGIAGSDVAVHTFHSFGTMLINQYPESFNQLKSLQALDDLNRYRIFEKLLAALPLRHQLAVRGENEQFIRRHAVEEAIRAFKQAGYTAERLREISADNYVSFKELQPTIDEIFSTTLSAKRLPAIRTVLEQQSTDEPLTKLLYEPLMAALEASETSGKTKPLGAWRDTYTTIKDAKRILKSQATEKLFLDVVTLYEQYQVVLATNGYYDYEDMILWAIEALGSNHDLLLDVAERYQYIMVDEYQDTNGAQNMLLATLLQANPLDAPNVLVVGDDDQAIMRFQGAELSGMVEFAQTYKPHLIVLQQNYRSSQAIIDAARKVMVQSSERLEVVLPELQLTKELFAANEPNQSSIRCTAYPSPSAQYAGIAEHIAALISDGVSPANIAVIGRKHAELATFVPYLDAKNIRSSYDRHEHILEFTQLVELLRLSEYIVALQKNQSRAAALLPGLLSASYWGLEALDTYQLAREAKIQDQSWLDTMLASKNTTWNNIAEWLIAASEQCRTINFTQCFDVLIGRQALDQTKLQTSPFITYTSPNSQNYTTLLSHLIRLRTAVLEANPNATGIADLLAVAKEYTLSGLRLVDRNPILRGDHDGVQVMSAHSSKGLEFEHVIILSATDTVWGSKARGQNQRIRLPENLPLYPAGDSDDDRLRLLYVAMTRAKSHIILSTYEYTDDGKPVPPLSYTRFEDDGWWSHQAANTVSADTAAIVETAWNPPVHIEQRTLQETLRPLLEKYRLSASALRTFLDYRYGGPQACIEQSVLKFPSAYNAHSALGSATHKTLELAYHAYKQGSLDIAKLIDSFDAVLSGSGLTEAELEPVRAHGHQFLPSFIELFSNSDFADITDTEQYSTAHLPRSNTPISGAIDAIAKSNYSLRVIDYKTGKPPTNGWSTTGLSDSKKISLHFYRQQLMFYKLLLDNSGEQPVTCAELVFAEPAEHSSGGPVRLMIDSFDSAELERTQLLAEKVYRHIQTGVLPDTASYPATLKGITAFEEAILASEL